MKVNLDDMAYFAAVVQYQGFTAAGKALAVPKSLLSRRIAKLEDNLGIRLINRSSRRFATTAIGAQYAEECQKMLEQANSAQLIVEQALAKPSGKLRVSALTGMAENWLAPIVSHFLQEYPTIELELLAINREVDIIEDRVDIAISSKPFPLTDSEYYVQVLMQHQSLLVASPDFIDQYKESINIDTIGKLPALLRRKGSGPEIWQLHHPTYGTKIIKPTARLTSNNLPVILQAIRDGIGIALMPEPFCTPYIEQGALQQILPEWQTNPSIVHAVYASNRGKTSAFKAFMDYLTKYLK